MCVRKLCFREDTKFILFHLFVFWKMSCGKMERAFCSGPVFVSTCPKYTLSGSYCIECDCSPSFSLFLASLLRGHNGSRPGLEGGKMGVIKSPMGAMWGVTCMALQHHYRTAGLSAAAECFYNEGMLQVIHTITWHLEPWQPDTHRLHPWWDVCGGACVYKWGVGGWWEKNNSLGFIKNI